jgi:hypothetical protein
MGFAKIFDYFASNYRITNQSACVTVLLGDMKQNKQIAFSKDVQSLRDG